MTVLEEVRTKFAEIYKEPAAYIVRAPGRVNLIGEHTDYNDGFVLPMAIDRAVYIALRPREDTQVIVHALDFDETYQFDAASLTKGEHSPVEYIKGVANALSKAGHQLKGWEGVLKGDVPVAAGLSSSAALELASARAFATVSGIEWNAAQMAKLGQQAENEWLGLKTGIMDQMISAAGQQGQALLIDCRSLETTPAPLPAGTVAVVLDTTTSRGLVDSKYNERREQCEAAAQFFGVSALRDVSVETFNASSPELDDVVRRRAKHVIYENQRTLDAIEAMNASDAEALGKLMIASHESLRDDYEVSSEALNIIVDCALQHPGCYGARMTGAGFGGCAVALVKEAEAQDFVQAAAACYQAATGLTPRIYVTVATDGANVIESNIYMV